MSICYKCCANQSMLPLWRISPFLLHLFTAHTQTEQAAFVMRPAWHVSRRILIRYSVGFGFYFSISHRHGSGESSELLFYCRIDFSAIHCNDDDDIFASRIQYLFPSAICNTTEYPENTSIQSTLAIRCSTFLEVLLCATTLWCGMADRSTGRTNRHWFGSVTPQKEKMEVKCVEDAEMCCVQQLNQKSYSSENAQIKWSVDLIFYFFLSA